MTKFTTDAVLSTSTGVLLGKIDGVYAVMSFLLGRSAFTHELAFYGRQAETALRTALPELPGKEDAEHVNGDNYRQELNRWEEQFGKEIDLPDSLKDCLADERNAISTLREMAPDKPIIGISN